MEEISYSTYTTCMIILITQSNMENFLSKLFLDVLLGTRNDLPLVVNV